MGKDQGICIYPHDLAVLSRRLEALKFDGVDCRNSCINPGEGGNPYNGLYGEALSVRGTFLRLHVYEKVWITI